jgi:imidazolonepropionase-like amidohydrolase
VKRVAERTLVAILAVALALAALPAAAATPHLAVRGTIVYTMAGPAIDDGVVLINDGKIVAVGPAAEVAVPAGYTVMQAKVVIPGLVDAHGTVGLTGFLNQPHDQDQLERSEPIQPELRALDAYNARDPLVAWVNSFGVTTVHTGHGPGALISGQTMIVKTTGDTVDQAMVKPEAMVAATLGPGALGDEDGGGGNRRRGGGPPAKSPGTLPKAVAMLRAELVAAQTYADKLASAEEGKRPDRNLRHEALGRVLAGEIPLLITAHRHQDILSALRIADELGLRIVLDGAAEAHLVIDEIRAAGVPVIVHPAMQRAAGEYENLSMTTAARLADAGIPIALQSGFEAYVPKTRVLLFEAALAAARGLGFERALAASTIGPARLLGIADRVGSLEVGKDADLALYDGDPFEYTSHCVAVVIDGEVVSHTVR